MKYLVQTTEIYRVDTEAEVQTLINEAKNANEYELAKYSSEKKDIKEKKEVIGEYYKVSLTKVFNDIKEPYTAIAINYEVE